MTVPTSPDVSLAIKDGALAAAAGTGDDCAAVIGVCTGGTANTVYLYRDPQQLAAALVSGPTGGAAVEMAALMLQTSGKPVLVVPVTQSVDGAVGSVTLTGTGVDPGVGFTGTPKDAYALRVKVTLAGARGTARFRIAFDADNPAGPTWSDELVTAASITTGPLAGTGLTLTFATGNYVAGDLYDATCTAPGFSNTNLQTAFAALKASPTAFRFVVVAGQGASVSASLATAGVLDTLLADLASVTKRYAWGLLQCADDTDANILAGIGSYAAASKRIGIAAGFADMTSVLTGRVLKRGIAGTVAARILKLRISQDAGEVQEGPLDAVQALYRDEFATPGLDVAGLITLRTFTGRRGFFINNPRMKVSDGSDFELVQYRQVMDLACTVAQSSLQQFVNRAVLVNPNGTINEGEAITIEDIVRADLASALLGSTPQASSLSVLVDRSVNVLTSKKISVRIRITPLGYLKAIEVDIGYLNPRVVVAAA